MEKSPEEKSKHEQAIVAMRKIWLFMVPIFAALAFYNLYRWTQEKNSLTMFWSMFGLMLLGLATIIGSRRKPLSYILMGIGGVAVIIGLVSVFYDLGT